METGIVYPSTVDTERQTISKVKNTIVHNFTGAQKFRQRANLPQPLRMKTYDLNEGDHSYMDMEM